METTLGHSFIFNQTYFNYTYSIEETALNLFVFILIWLILIVTITCGTIGNVLVLYVYINRNDNKTSNFLIKVLAAVDLIICCILAPLELYQTTKGIHSEILCKFYGFLHTHVLYSTFLITIIAFDRYFCICWPLYKIITIHRARVLVVVCCVLSSILALIPTSEYSTFEHAITIHQNHSMHLPIEINSEFDLPTYVHVESIKQSITTIPFSTEDRIDVKCSPRFSLHLYSFDFFIVYRMFHVILFAICVITVFILYLFIYNAIYQRRRTRTKRFSTYRKIIHSYLINDESECKRFHKRAPFNSICCYCCNKLDENSSKKNRSNNEENDNNIDCKNQNNKAKPSERITLEVRNPRGKRYSAISMTSMTYFTSGTWDEPSSANVVNSKLSSANAVGNYGPNNVSNIQPMVSTEESFDQIPKSSALKFTASSNAMLLTVPGRQSPITSILKENSIKDNKTTDVDSLGTVSSSSSLLSPSTVRKPSSISSVRQQQRSAETTVSQRKVSFMTSIDTGEHGVNEDSPNPNQRLPLHMDNHCSLQISSTIDSTSCSRTNSISSTSRRISGFDCDTPRLFERQQKQQRLANIRTTLSLSVVTVTFIFMYLPSIIINLFNIKPNDFRELLFLLYYVNSACNPIIYSFLNVNFRNDIRHIYQCRKRERLTRQT